MTTLHGVEIKVGDKVWDSRYGWSEVVAIHNDEEYKIETTYSYYTHDGKYVSEDRYPSLFWNKFEVPKEAFIKPLPKLEVDTKVLVWNNDNTKERRYFPHIVLP